MKKSSTITKIVSFGILLLFISCTQDDLLRDGATTEHTEEGRQGFISFERLTKQIGTSAAFNDNIQYFDRNKITHAGRGGEFVEAYIDTEIIHLIETETTNFYTLKIINNNPEERTNIFYNLVFSENLVTGEVSSSILQYRPELGWLFDKAHAFEGDIKIYDDPSMTFEDLFNGENIDSERFIETCIFSISIVWQCTENNHSAGTPGCGGNWVFSLNTGPCPPGGGGGGGDGGDGGDTGGGGGGGSSGSTQTVILEICNGFTHDGDPGDSEDCEDEYADYFTPYICEVDFALINFINGWVPNNQDAATELASYLKSNFPEDDSNNCAEVDFEEYCGVAQSLNVSCSELFIFEQDYRKQMSESELSLFDSLELEVQMKYLYSAKEAIDKTDELFYSSCEKYNGKGDAFRHMYWNALSSSRIGIGLTNQLTTKHENKPPSYPYSSKETQMDLFNNQIGRDLIFNGSSNILQDVLNALNNGDLRYLSNQASDCRATFNSTLIPTNQ